MTAASPAAAGSSSTSGAVPVDTMTVLFVCTGNICRSPIAERLTRARLADGARTRVSLASAGTRAVTGWPMDQLAADVLRDLGGDPEGHVARQLDLKAVRSVDLVLTASAIHRDRILREHPVMMRRIFTMREFARLAADLPPLPELPDAARLRARVGEVAARRGIADAVEPVADEIGDPFGAAREVMVACGETIAAAVDGLVSALGLQLR